MDRTAELLPWQGAADVERLSPIEVSARYLSHIRDVWNVRFPQDPLPDQDIVIGYVDKIEPSQSCCVNNVFKRTRPITVGCVHVDIAIVFVHLAHLRTYHLSVFTSGYGSGSRGYLRPL